MMSRLFVLLIASCSFCFLSFGQVDESIPLDVFSKEALLKNVENLSSDAFEGRKTGTRGGQRARKYVINEFTKRQVQAFFKSYVQPFSFTYNDQFYEASNVLGYIKGAKFPDKFIVISAHYDHVGIKNGAIYNGADDNASGVSALFAFAEYFKKYPPNYSVILAAFDGEELGLQGSKYFVNSLGFKLKKVVFNINMDMISRSDKNELYAVGSGHFPYLKPIINQIKHTNNFKLSMGHDIGDWKDDWTYASDHAPFYKKGIPFLYFGVEDHLDYHEPTDDFQNIQPEFYTEAVKAIMLVFQKIDELSL
ncbi:M28 family peptidase [Aestuariibaculum sp. TT11]|uniref:M28 family peptidase n=2 Tax=Aestuariibaculum sediminum TaxID=2770637 RepID=A0A8J6Q1F5_9FLAO|nr:M28 family peptidase [Aestuariibaculum sediminum]